MSSNLKPFTIKNEDTACIIHWQCPRGKQLIDVDSMTIDSSTARKLSKWLLQAADEIATYNRKRSIRIRMHGPGAGEGGWDDKL